MSFARHYKPRERADIGKSVELESDNIKRWRMPSSLLRRAASYHDRQEI